MRGRRDRSGCAALTGWAVSGSAGLLLCLFLSTTYPASQAEEREKTVPETTTDEFPSFASLSRQNPSVIEEVKKLKIFGEEPRVGPGRIFGQQPPEDSEKPSPQLQPKDDEGKKNNGAEKKSDPKASPPMVGWTKGFSDASQMIRAAMDPTADPCQDFYQYACGNWMKNNPIPKSANSISSFGKLAMEVYHNLTLAFASVNTSSTNTAQPKSVLAAAKAYQICMNSSLNSSKAGSQLLEAIETIKINGWPMISPNWTQPNVSLEALVGWLDAYYSLPTLLKSMVDTDWKNISSFALFVDQGTLALGSRQYYINPKFAPNMASYQNLIVSVGKQLRTDAGSTVTDAEIQADAAKIVAYETSLAYKTIPMSERRNYEKQFNVFSYNQLLVRWGKFNWADYYTYLLSLHNPKYLMNLGDRFNIMEPGYVDELHSDILSFPDKRTVYNYLVWRFVMQNLQFLPTGYRQAYEEFRMSFDDIEALPPANETCASLLVNYMPFATGNLYVNTYFPKNIRPDVSSMISNVLSAFGEMLNGLNWLDASSKFGALRKKSAVLQNVAYPDWSMDPAKLDAFDKGFITALNGTTSFWSVLSALRFQFQHVQFAPLGTPGPDRANFLWSPALVNAWYQPERNSITFPAAILNQPFYRADYPKAVNYGAMGVVMGHELSHGFDDEGSQYNWNGTLAPWMSSSSRQGFETMASCVVSEYNQFCYGSSCVNGVNTQGENIADNGGIVASHNAYKIWSSIYGNEPRLPGLEDFNLDQIFFLSYGHIWCRNSKQSSIVNGLLTDVHSPARARINGVVRNTDAFGVAFNCPRNSPMFPSESAQCHVYRPVPLDPPQPQPPTPTPTQPPSPPSQGWTDAANILLEGLDTTVDPCQDFYHFACGTWIKNHTLAPHQSMVDTFDELQDKIVDQIISSLNSVNSSDPKVPKTLVAAQNMYESCISSSDSDHPNAASLLNIIQSFHSAFMPMITPNWTSPPSDFNPWKQVAEVESYFLTSTLLYSSVSADWGNTSQNALYISQGSLGLGNRQYYLNPYFDNVVASYEKLIVEVGTLLAADNKVQMPLAQIQKDAEAIVNFEKRMAGFLVPGSEERNYQTQFNPFNFTQLIRRWPSIDWTAYIYELMELHIETDHVRDRFIVTEPRYMDALHGAMTTTSLRTFINFVDWRFIYDNLEFLGPDYRSALLKFRAEKDSVSALPPGKISCAYSIMYYMPYAAGRLYLGPLAGPNLDKARADVALQTRNVINSFTGMLNDLPWMDPVSKSMAVKKIAALYQNIAYPDWIMNDAQLDEYHWEYIKYLWSSKGRSYFFQNQMMKFAYSQTTFQLLLQKPNRHDFLDSPAEVNAWYEPDLNSITFPFGILNSPYYRYDFPQALNYGGQGATAGHELTHGFDDEGVQFNGNGTLSSWMTPASKQGFSNMAQCVIKQYSNYCYPSLGNLCINGKTTQGENIADIGGLRAAYYAYQAFVAANAPEPRLPHLSQYSMNQIFFLAYARGWCTQMSSSRLTTQLITNVHSPAKWRVNGVLADIPEFAQQFNCKVGVDPMAPSPNSRCTVW